MSAYMNTICLKRHLLASQRILSYIVTAASCLSSVNFTLVCQSFLEHIRYILNKMEGDDDLVDENRKMIIQALSAEGFPNELEQQLLIKRSDLESALIGSCSTSGLIAFSGNVHLFWDSEI
ncbi:hypothetical protein BLNAU_20984 [Blattamonas nauphoetae]|uniref:UBA domain-containing protein n=1 Tax=Blattamonas nauphoetae TaxID=2049346 RepID=A0ABQ9WX91_9EUKA|nr:hypothetical protein BLNAU_20984 [Blattamonas nauphoetae]